MNKIYILGREEVPKRLTLRESDDLHITFIAWPGYNGDVDFEIDIERPGANLDIAALYLNNNGDRVDFNITVRHLVGGSKSRQLFKGVVGDRASAKFNGLIYVAPDAQQTEAYQENHTLLMSDGKVETSPKLEIYADDVKCSHGASVGRLNPDELFYMRSRGIPEEEAERMQIISFISDVLARLPEDLQERIISMI